MKLKSITLAVILIFTVTFTAIAGDDASPGDIVINEFMADPSKVADSVGEWVEIVNTTDSIINIDGWTLLDDDVDDHIINSGAPLNVAPNDYVILCRNDNSANNGGVSCDYEYSGFQLANTGDEIVLKDDGGQEIARRDYTSSSSSQSSFYVPSDRPPAGGYFSDNNTDSRWADTDASTENRYGSGDYGTPGAKNEQSGEDGTPTLITLLSLGARSEVDGSSPVAKQLLFVLFGLVALSGTLLVSRGLPS